MRQSSLSFHLKNRASFRLQLLAPLRCRTIAAIPSAASDDRCKYLNYPSTCSRLNSYRTVSSVFVSKHNQSLQVSSQAILDFCQHHSIAYNARTTNSHVILKECPFCPKPTNDKADNQFKLYIAAGSGAYFCHRCGASGSWFDFKLKVGGPKDAQGGIQKHPATFSEMRAKNYIDTEDRELYSGPKTTKHSAIQPLPMPPKRLQALYSSSLFAQDAATATDTAVSSTNAALTYLVNERGLSPKTLRKYGVGRANYAFATDKNGWQQQECITFSWIMSVKEAEYQESLRGATFPAADFVSDPDQPNAKEQTYVTRRIKARAIHDKSMQRLDPPGGAWGFFGYHTIPHDAKELVLTEGEYDAMAVWQATGRPAISLPNGCRSLPVETLPMLENIEKIYLWMDNDAPGQEGAQLFAKKLGHARCYIVRPTRQNVTSEELPKDANDALRSGCDLNKIIDDAKLMPHEHITNFEELRADVLHEIMYPDKFMGTGLPSLPKFTSIIKGLRRGELTILTGPTGSGKTTLLGQLSLDLAEQAINVLWGSFEIKNTRLLHKLLQQFSREPLPKGDPSMEDYLNTLADRFSLLPLNFMRFHGGSDVDDVLDAMEYAVYVNDCQHIILDNMQFMISRQKSSNSTFDKFDVQDIAIEKFRKFATEKNVHVTLVMHPKKEAEDSRLNISSFYGSAKATQEADTILILQNERGKKSIEVKKNRFDGDLGFQSLFFDRRTGRYTEEPPFGNDASKPVARGIATPRTIAMPMIEPPAAQPKEPVGPRRGPMDRE